jgi:hypothetical protein
VTDIPKGLGRTFLLVGFLPALVLMVLNSAFIVPSLPALGDFLDQPILGLEGGFYILIPLAIGCLLTALAEPVTLVYEGVYGFERSFLLKPLLWHGQKQHEKLYADLVSLKQAYVSEKDEFRRRSLIRAISQEHRKLFECRQADILPYDKRRLLPTRLGNTWAAIEEYPAYRYGMDGVIFWPRLRACIPKEYLETIDSEAVHMRFLLNLSFVVTCFGIESVVMALIAQGLSVRALTAVAWGISSLLVAYILYRASVALTRSLGELVRSSFDLYRHELLAELGVDWKPETRIDERRTWIGLAQYLVTGEDAYWPEPPLETVESVGVQDPSGKIGHYWKLAHTDVTIAEYGANAPLDVLMVALEAEQLKGNA